MVGKDIPLITRYTITKNGVKSYKKPMYEIKTYEEVKAHQDKLGDNTGWYYGVTCNKCCGVYPKFCTEQDFKGDGYYLCLVCGKESVHKSMPWQSAEEWNKGHYLWQPEEDKTIPKDYQMTIFDLLKSEV